MIDNCIKAIEGRDEKVFGALLTKLFKAFDCIFHDLLIMKLTPIRCQCCPHIETSKLISTENQLTGFYMGTTLAFNELRAYGSSILALKLIHDYFHNRKQRRRTGS